MGNFLSNYPRGCCCTTSSLKSYMVNYDHDDDDDNVEMVNNFNQNCMTGSVWASTECDHLADSAGDWTVTEYNNANCTGFSTHKTETDDAFCYTNECVNGAFVCSNYDRFGVECHEVFYSGANQYTLNPAVISMMCVVTLRKMFF